MNVLGINIDILEGHVEKRTVKYEIIKKMKELKLKFVIS